jgi:hypothetical protein
MRCKPYSTIAGTTPVGECFSLTFASVLTACQTRELLVPSVGRVKPRRVLTSTALSWLSRNHISLYGKLCRMGTEKIMTAAATGILFTDSGPGCTIGTAARSRLWAAGRSIPPVLAAPG